MAKDKIKLELEVEGLDKVNSNLDNAEKSADSLRKQFIEAKKEVDRLASADVIDQAAMDEAIGKMAELKDRMNDVNEEVNIFASGSKYEQVSNAFGSIGKSLVSLDFGKAQQRAEAFSKAASTISFGDAIKSLKQLGSTFVTIGKSLLTNPLFLLAAVFVGIALAIANVMEKMGLMKQITEAVGAVFDWLYGMIEKAINAITDFFGITSKKEREATKALEDQAAQFEKTAKAASDKSKEAIQGLDQEIRMARLQGEDTEDLERRKVKLLMETAKAQAVAADAAVTAAIRGGKATQEEIDKLREKARETKMAFQQTLNDVDFFEAELQKKRDDAAKKEADDLEKRNIDAANKRKAAADKRKADELKFANDRLVAERQLEDLRLANLEEGVEKELEISRVKYERLIADTLNNERLLESEKEALIAQFEIQRQANEDAINEAERVKGEEKTEKEIEDERLKEEKRLNLQNEFRIRRLEQQGEFEEADLIEAELKRDAEIERLNQALAEDLLSEVEHKALLEQLEEEHGQRLDDIREKYAEEEKKREDLLRAHKINGVQNAFDTVSNLAEIFNNGSEKSAKRAFKVQKGMQIANATIDTFKAATSAYASLAPIPIVGPALGAVAAAAAVTAGIANIKKIAQTKFEPGGGSTAVPSKPSVPDVPTSAPTPPSLFGDELEGSTGGNGQTAGSRQEGGMMRAIVVESDITNTQNRLSNYQQRSEID